jgi:hypothetical protein
MLLCFFFVQEKKETGNAASTTIRQWNEKLEKNETTKMTLAVCFGLLSCCCREKKKHDDFERTACVTKNP